MSWALWMTEQPLAEKLSGGQRRKAALVGAREGLRPQDFDVLLLDEPTNHLDEWMPHGWSTELESL